MRETLKSLSIFSAMLLLLLLISSGCDVNIPGCGKRSLPFFKKIMPPTPTPPPAVSPPGGNAPATAVSMTAMPLTTLQAGPTKQPTLETSVEMSISKPKAVPTATPTATATPMEVEKIAYTTMEQGKPTLWTMNTDGTERIRLTAVGTGAWYPLWSPNGKMLAFLSDMNHGELNLYIMKKGSVDVTQITSYSDMTLTNPNSLKPPFSWSPKSDEIAYIYKNQVWKVDTSTLSQVTLVSTDPAYVISRIEWAPHRDTKYVAFSVKKGARFFSLGLVNPRLMDKLTLDDPQLPLMDLTWSPDARMVAYILDKNAIYTASPNTSVPKVIIWGASPEIGPLLSYSPAESTSPPILALAKQASNDDGYRVAIVDKPAKETVDKAAKGTKDSGTLKYLTEPGVVDAIWSPDGNKIAYVQNGELWVMDAPTGNNKKRIAATGIQTPNWSKK